MLVVLCWFLLCFDGFLMSFAGVVLWFSGGLFLRGTFLQNKQGFFGKVFQTYDINLDWPQPEA